MIFISFIVCLLKYYRENITLQIEFVQGEVDLELVKEREDALQQLEVSFVIVLTMPGSTVAQW